MISTAAGDLDSPLGRLRRRAMGMSNVHRAGPVVEAKTRDFHWLEWSLGRCVVGLPCVRRLTHRSRVCHHDLGDRIAGPRPPSLQGGNDAHPAPSSHPDCRAHDGSGATGPTDLGVRSVFSDDLRDKNTNALIGQHTGECARPQEPEHVAVPRRVHPAEGGAHRRSAVRRGPEMDFRDPRRHRGLRQSSGPDKRGSTSPVRAHLTPTPRD